MINITKPFLPPIEEFEELVKGIWKRNWLTNNGPLVNELEIKLKDYLGIDHLLFLNNGTIALQIAIKALELKGEVITTPFSFVATTSSLVWEGITPVFVDIHPETLNIDADKIESAITERTTGILATHVYGNPCDIDKIEEIAARRNLKVIYDAAHCFGTKFKGKSVFHYGDISITSYHATKLYHSIEGGGVFTRHPELLKKMAYMRNFGFDGPEDFAEVGINGKNSEFHAAMGLVNLRYIDKILSQRKHLSQRYDTWLEKMEHQKISISKHAEFNYAYYPIILKSEEFLLACIKELNGAWIYPRRYFYPSLSSLPYVPESHNPVSDEVAKRILCLPLCFDLQDEEVDLICRIMLRTQNYFRK